MHPAVLKTECFHANALSTGHFRFPMAPGLEPYRENSSKTYSIYVIQLAFSNVNEKTPEKTLLL